MMLAYLRKVMRRAEDRGASAVEYGLLIAAIAAVIVVAVTALGTALQSTFNNTKTSLCKAPNTCSSLQLPDADNVESSVTTFI